MRWNRQRSLESLVWALVSPALLVAIFNPDLASLILGAFGPPAASTLTRWLVTDIAVCIAALLWLQRVRDPHSAPTARWRVVGLAAASLTALGAVQFRDRMIRTEDVAFSGPTIRFGATIYRPTTPGPHPALVFVHGSAPFKRGFYSLWATHLAERGVIAVVADKRGVGATGGEFERENNTSRVNLDLLADDAVATLDFAARLTDVDSTRLGLFGLSQAGWVAPMAAARSPLAHFIIMMTGPTVSVHEEGVWSNLRGDDQRAAKYSRASAERVMDTVVIGGVDARPRLAALTIPGLWLFGSDDNSIPTRQSVRVLDSLRAIGKRFQSTTFPRAGHLLFIRERGLLPHVAPAAWDSIDAWMSRELRPIR